MGGFVSVGGALTGMVTTFGALILNDDEICCWGVFFYLFLSFFFILQFAKEMANMTTRWKIGLIYRSITRSFLFF